MIFSVFCRSNNVKRKFNVNLIKEKLIESLKSVLPIALIVIGLSITIVPMNTGYMFLFLVGIVCPVFGMSLFTAGAEMSMQPLGSKIGSTIGASKKIWLIAVMRIVFNWNLTYIMIGFYALAFVLAFFVDKSFLPLSFDSGGAVIFSLPVDDLVGVGRFEDYVDGEENH